MGAANQWSRPFFGRVGLASLARAAVAVAVLVGTVHCKQMFQSAAVSRIKGGDAGGGGAGKSNVHYLLSDAHVDARDFLGTPDQPFDAKAFVETGKVPGNYTNTYSAQTKVFAAWMTQLTQRFAANRATTRGYTILFNGDPFQRAPFEKGIPAERRAEAMKNFGDVLRVLAAKAGTGGAAVDIIFNFGDHEKGKTGKFWQDSAGANVADPVLATEQPLEDALKDPTGKQPIRVISNDPRLGSVVRLQGGDGLYLRHIQYENSPEILAQAACGFNPEDRQTPDQAIQTAEKRLVTLFEATPPTETVDAIVERAAKVGLTGQITIVTSDSHMPVTGTVTSATGASAHLIGTGAMASSAKGAVPNTIVELQGGKATYLALDATFTLDANRVPTDVTIPANDARVWDPATELGNRGTTEFLASVRKLATDLSARAAADRAQKTATFDQASEDRIFGDEKAAVGTFGDQASSDKVLGDKVLGDKGVGGKADVASNNNDFSDVTGKDLAQAGVGVDQANALSESARVQIDGLDAQLKGLNERMVAAQAQGVDVADLKRQVDDLTTKERDIREKDLAKAKDVK